MAEDSSDKPAQGIIKEAVAEEFFEMALKTSLKDDFCWFQGLEKLVDIVQVSPLREEISR